MINAYSGHFNLHAVNVRGTANLNLCQLECLVFIDDYELSQCGIIDKNNHSQGVRSANFLFSFVMCYLVSKLPRKSLLALGKSKKDF